MNDFLETMFHSFDVFMTRQMEMQKHFTEKAQEAKQRYVDAKKYPRKLRRKYEKKLYRIIGFIMNYQNLYHGCKITMFKSNDK